ncbi:MAG: response regulator [bacterium]|nr:response regulator [bacterium]
MSKQILIIEDSEKQLNILLDIFEDEGYTVFTAKNKDEVEHQLADGKKFDLLIIDVYIPGYIDTEILGLTERYPFLVVSGIVGETDIKRVVPDSNRYLLKPYNPDELIARVKLLTTNYDKKT